MVSSSLKMQSKMGILSFLSFSHFKKKSFFFKDLYDKSKREKKKQGSLVWIKIKAIHTCVSLTFLEVNRYLFCSLICVKMLAIWGQVEWGRGHKCWATRPRGVANDSFCSQNGGCMAHLERICSLESSRLRFCSDSTGCSLGHVTFLDFSYCVKREY